MKKVIITIGREYGSGGKYIGKRVAEELGIKCYDKELLQKAYEKNGYSYSKLQQYDEQKRNGIIKALNLLNTNDYDAAFEDDMCRYIIAETIKDIASQESCVIIGRNANNILKDNSNTINIFIYSNNEDFKIKRKMQIENLSYEETEKRLKYVDKQRKKYYEQVNKNHIWGDKKEYDYCIDSYTLGIEGTVDLIVNIYKEFMDIEK
jgi:cytidylate kinase